MGMNSYQPAPMSSGLDDLLGLGSDGLLGDIGGTTSPSTVPAPAPVSTGNIFGGVPPFVPPASVPAPAPQTFPGLDFTGGFVDAPAVFVGGQTGYVGPKTVR